MSRLTPLARRLRTAQTSAEELVWNALRSRRFDGHKFRRQMPVAGFIADFCCWRAKLIIEIDGAHHAAQIVEDAERRRRLEEAGFTELRFTNDEVRGRLNWVVQEIGRALDAAAGREQRRPALRID